MTRAIVDHWTVFAGWESADFHLNHSIRAIEKRASTSVYEEIEPSIGTWGHWGIDCRSQSWRLLLRRCGMYYVMAKFINRRAPSE